MCPRRPCVFQTMVEEIIFSSRSSHVSHQAPAPLTEQLGSIKPPFPHFTNDRFSAQKNNQCLAIQVKHGIFFSVIIFKVSEDV